MHFEGIWLCLAIGVLCMRSLAATNGLHSPMFMSEKNEYKIERRAGERAVVPSVEVQHDIIMYWSKRFLGDSDVYIVLEGSNFQTERIHLQQNTGIPRYMRLFTAKPLVYRVMIKPVPGLNTVVVSSSNGTLPNFDKILIVRNNEIVYEFLPTLSSKRRLIMKALLMNETSRVATLANEYQAVSIRFTENGMCVNPQNSVLPPPISTQLVLRYNCGTLDTFFTIIQDGKIQHIASGLYIDGDLNNFGGVIPVNGSSAGANQPPPPLSGEDEGQIPIDGSLNDDGELTSDGGKLVDSDGYGMANTGDDSRLVSTVDHGGFGGRGGYSELASTSGHGGNGKLVSTSSGIRNRYRKPARIYESGPASTDGGGGHDGDDGNTKLASTDVGGDGINGKPVRVDDVHGGNRRPSSIGDGDVINNKPASIDGGGGYGRLSSSDDDFESNGDVKLADVNDDGKLVRAGNIGKENKILGGEEIARMDTPQARIGMHGTMTSHLSNLHRDYPFQRHRGVHRTFPSLRGHLYRGPQNSNNVLKTSPNQRQNAVRQPFHGLKDRLYYTPQYNKVNSQYKSSRPIVAHALLKDYNKRSVTLRSQVSQTLDLYLTPESNLKFQYTSYPKNYQTLFNGTDEQDEEILPHSVRGFENRNLPARSWKVKLRKFVERNEGQFKRREVLHVKTVKASNKRALVTDLKYYLQENETGLCIGYQNKQVVLMPCQSVPSSVEFYGKSRNRYTSQTKEQLRNPVTPSEIQSKTEPPPVQPAIIEKPYTTPPPVVSQCGSSCPSSCYPSCTQSCCNTGMSYTPQDSGSCGSECPSSCYPSCTSSCCDTEYPDNQGTSPYSQSSCPSSCASATQCPSSQCPQYCCPAQGESYTSQNQICPSGCKKSCRPSCPFNCC